MTPRSVRLLSGSTPDLSELTFEPFREGIEKALVFRDSESTEEVSVLRYQPGAGVPSHLHEGYEYILVLEGSQQDERGIHRAGSLVINTPGSSHVVSSPEGCTVLAIWARPVVFE